MVSVKGRRLRSEEGDCYRARKKAVPSAHSKVVKRNCLFLSPSTVVSGGSEGRVSAGSSSFSHSISSLLSLSLSISSHAGHITPREGAVGWTYKIIIISLAIPRLVEEAPSYLEGVSRTPPHDLIAGSWEAGMASDYMAPERALGMGAAEKSAGWRDVT